MMIVCIDLDNTLIYSYKRDIGEKKRCVEVYKGREVSFMTEKSCRLLEKVSEKAMIVPITTRSIEQYQRVKLGIQVKYALTCNGGILLKNGEKDIGWNYHSLKLVERPWDELLKAIEILETDKNRSMEVRFIEQLFVFSKSDEPEKTVHRLRQELDLEQIDVFGNGDKIYAIPKILSKGNAIRRFKEEFGEEYVIAAGDSEFDISMAKEADRVIIPETLSERITTEKCVVIGKEKIFSDEMLEYVLEELKE